MLIIKDDPTIIPAITKAKDNLLTILFKTSIYLSLSSITMLIFVLPLIKVSAKEIKRDGIFKLSLVNLYPFNK